MRAAGGRILVGLALVALSVGAVVGSNVFSARDRLLGSALPAPVVPATSRAADYVPPGSPPERTALRSAPWWQTVKTFEGTGSAELLFTIDPRAVDWRATWSCDTGHIVIRALWQQRPVVDANCPRGTERGDRKGSTRLDVSAAGRWRIEIAQRLDIPVVEPPLVAMTAPGTTALTTGSFYKVDRIGAGTVTIYDQPDGYTVRLEDFWVSPKDSLQLRLSTAAAPRTSQEFLSARSQLLADLDVTAGSLNYIAPAGVDPAEFRSVVIWSPSDRSVYAAARLEPPT